MSIADIESFDPGQYYYNLNDKLWTHIMKRSEECFQRAEKVRNAIQTQEELLYHTKKMKQFFINSIGGIPYDASLPLNSSTTGVIEEDDLRIEKVIFESRPKVYVTANLYFPKNRKEKCGAVLFQVGHAELGKAYPQYQRVARNLVSAGLIVLVIDPVGQGERLGYFEPDLKGVMVGACTSEHQYVGEQCVLLGDNIARYFICDAMRAIDYLISRPEVDHTKIGATGSSGGGIMTSYLMVCDDRICAAATGTFITKRQEYLYAGGAQDAEQIWMGATEFGFDHNELLMCFAPKPLLILAVDSDFFPIEGTKTVFEESKQFWHMYGAAEKIDLVIDCSQHAYTDALAMKAARFFARELNGEEKSVQRSMLNEIECRELNCTQSGQVCIEFEAAKFIYNENAARYQVLRQERNPGDVERFLREKIDFQRVRTKPNVRVFTPIYENGLKVQPLLWFTQPQMPNFGLLFSHFQNHAVNPHIILCLWENGTNDIERNIFLIREICGRGDMAFVVDLAGMGKCIPYSLNAAYSIKGKYGVLDRCSKDLFFLNDSLCALRLFDLEKAIEMIKKWANAGKVSLYATGLSAAYVRLLALLIPSLETQEEHSLPNWQDFIIEKYYEDYNIAGILMPSLLKYI